MITGNDIRRNARKTPPERVFLTPEGGLSLGNYPKEELVEYVRRDIDQSAELAALRAQVVAVAGCLHSVAQEAYKLTSHIEGAKETFERRRSVALAAYQESSQ